MVNQCCAIGCGKKQSKGTTILKAFPRDPDRRQKWATAAGVSQIKPGSRLCHLHFDESQYEQHRQDGLKKLKPNAVPTLFGDVLTDYLSKDHQDKSNTIHDASWTSCESLNQLSTMDLDESLSSSLPNVSDVIIDECTTDNPTSLSELPKSDNTKSVPSDEQQIELPLINLDKEHSVSIFTHNVYPDTLNSVSSIPADELHAELINKYNQEVIKLNLMLQDQHRLHQHEISSLSKEVESLKKINIRLEGELRVEQEKRIESEQQREKIENKLNRLFNVFDNSSFLKNLLIELSNDNKRYWSPQLVKSAVQLRFAIGWKGYQFIQNQLKIPLPSYSTVCRAVSNFNFDPGFLSDLAPLLEKKRQSHTSSTQDDCILLLDEFELQKQLEFEQGAMFHDIPLGNLTRKKKKPDYYKLKTNLSSVYVAHRQC